MARHTVPALVVAAAIAGIAGCAKKGAGDGEVGLNGAGATFPYPLYSKWVSEFQKQNPKIQINYQSIGSGGGIRQIIERTVDFGATDAPMSDEQLAKAPGKLVHIPTTLGAVVVTYNLPEVGTLKLDGEALAAIFLGQITAWNDPRLAALNPGVSLPERPIAVVHRSDGSGTTAIFTDYLAKVSPAWTEKVGKGTSVSWPLGLGAKGNEGVTGQLKTTPGAIGYVELAYAVQSRLPVAALENRAGAFVAPTIDGITAAAAGVAASMPADLRVSIVDAPGEKAYPISAFTYVLVYADTPDARRGEALARFLWWAVHEGQQFAPPLHYARLPPEVVAKVEARLKGLQSGGKTLLPPG